MSTTSGRKSVSEKSTKADKRLPSSSPTRPVLDLLDNQLEQLADELHRRRQGPSPGMRSSSGDEEILSKVPLGPSPARGMTSQSRLANGSSGEIGTGNSTSAQRRPTQTPISIEDQDPTQMLNTWLGELDLLQRGLQETPSGFASHQNHRNHPNGGGTSGSIISSSGISMTPSPLSSNSTFGSNAAILSKGSNNNCNNNNNNSGNNNPSSRESSATPIHMRRMSTPRVESPRLDSYRYSLINLEETLDNDLDAILGELCALESNLNQKPARKSTNSSLIPDVHEEDRDDPTDLPPPPAPLQLEELLASEPQYITAESVRQNKLLAKRTDSPDNDSAFCENASSDSSNTSDNTTNAKSSSILIQSAIGNNNSTNPLYSSRKPSVGQETRSCLSSAGGASAHHRVSSSATVHPSINEQTCLNAATQAKAEKIRLALEKIKEASIKKIFIKVFGEDGSTKSLLVDERMSVSQVCGMLAEKNYVKRDTSWALVELLPDLHMERAYEDHECLVENLLMWKADSKNTLWFIKRPEVYDLFNRPELYLLGDTSSQIGTKMEERARSELIEEYFSSTGVGAPEVEGYLWLKAEGKKTWKKFYFVLRTSGLYYAPKGKKTSKDLVCLARLDMNQVYFGVKWQPKFKSPSKHCLAIKHPQIQAKNPKYIRYLCADTEIELNKWVTGIRLAKYGKTIYANYRGIIEEMTHEDLDRLASARNSLNTSTSPPGDDLVDEAIKKGPRSHLSHLSSHPSSLLSHSSDPRGVLSSPPPVTTVIVHSSHNGGVQCRSSRSSSASLSDRSIGCGSVGNGGVGGGPGELGFSCDSPEGGTIKKKPIAKSSLLSFKAESERETNGE
ncbi:abnormal cell migration protein 10-like [Tigriopus californicus]|uniref:abnormal cell migration protein 10-like n=1 Tax=Tigriopus californicus TaxID=6832 RepID=UPI0027DA8C87|nr:abnormal cell migration protein 10-like [Tigriopus californicus]